ncbi:MAG: aminotransferase class I/II-fold pyridoxal phosphate-dependent enzyme, partial [Myxococcota bacterium]
MTLSQRGARLVSGATPEYLLTHFERSSDRWDPKTNPNGYLGLCVAENGRVWDLIGPRVNRARTVPARAFAYDSMLGSTHFRERLAAFLGERLAGRDLHPEQVSALSGAGTVLESLFYTITDPGDAVLVPTPSYAGFWHDLETRIQSQIIPVHGRSDSGFEVSAADLEAAYTASERPVRA